MKVTKTAFHNYHKFFLSVILLMMLTNISFAQINALTENGKQVILFDDGTWKFKTDKSSDIVNNEIKLNPEKFSKSDNATFAVKSNIVNVCLFINPDKWTFKTHLDNETTPEYRFNLKSGTGYAMLLGEKIQLDLEALRNIALANAQKAAVDAKITLQEYREVNNVKVLFLEMSGTIKTLKFKYMGYYYANKTGIVQLLTYTTETNYADVKKELETFLNGLTEVD